MIWVGMSRLYEEQWTNSKKIDPDPYKNTVAMNWARFFKDVSVKQVTYGLLKVSYSGERYPPNMVVFRHICLEKTFEDHIEGIMAEQKERSKQLPKPASKEVAAKHIKQIKKTWGIDQ